MTIPSISVSFFSFLHHSTHFFVLSSFFYSYIYYNFSSSLLHFSLISSLKHHVIFLILPSTFLSNPFLLFCFFFHFLSKSQPLFWLEKRGKIKYNDYYNWGTYFWMANFGHILSRYHLVQMLQILSKLK